jgi:hypothetical protein
MRAGTHPAKVAATAAMAATWATCWKAWARNESVCTGPQLIQFETSISSRNAGSSK